MRDALKRKVNIGDEAVFSQSGRLILGTVIKINPSKSIHFEPGKGQMQPRQKWVTHPSKVLLLKDSSPFMQFKCISGSDIWPEKDDWTYENILYDMAEKYFNTLPGDSVTEEDYDSMNVALCEFIEMSWEHQNGRRQRKTY